MALTPGISHTDASPLFYSSCHAEGNDISSLASYCYQTNQVLKKLKLDEHTSDSYH